jgi:hypothetical protein
MTRRFARRRHLVHDGVLGLFDDGVLRLFDDGVLELFDDGVLGWPAR